jgi:hypothetical protein
MQIPEDELQITLVKLADGRRRIQLEAVDRIDARTKI